MGTPLHVLEEENRALRDTVKALRGIVDDTNSTARARLLAIQAVAEAAMREMQETIAILRARLERTDPAALPADPPAAGESGAALAEPGHPSEATTDGVRELIPAGPANLPVDADGRFGSERTELRATIRALRDRLSAREDYWERTVQGLAESHRRQTDALMATTAALRAAVAGLDGEQEIP